VVGRFGVVGGCGVVIGGGERRVWVVDRCSQQAWGG
jgi:hypothetical protein